LILFVDTALKTNYIALFDGIKLVRYSAFPQADQLMSALEAFNPPLENLEYLAVGTGPGSYTGVRQGVIAMQSLSFAKKLPLKGISSLEIFEKKEGEIIATDAKIGGFYVLKGDSPEVVLKEKILEWMDQGYRFKSPDSEILNRKCPEISFEMALPHFEALGEKIAQKPFKPIEIHYLRESV
jgi:tRNA A37 threonylcarbamoyladenosine modification protein TsaB